MKLSILTPESEVFQGETDYLKVPAALGPMEVLKNHAPIVTSLRAGEVVFKQGGSTRKITITGGFLEVSHNNGVLLADSAK